MKVRELVRLYSAVSTTPFMTGEKRQPSTRSKPRTRKSRRPSVASILRESYRLYMRDRETRQAVKACLRGT